MKNNGIASGILGKDVENSECHHRTYYHMVLDIKYTSLRRPSTYKGEPGRASRKNHICLGIFKGEYEVGIVRCITEWIWNHGGQHW